VERAAKAEQVTELKGVFKTANTVVVAHYAGLTVAQMQILRKQARQAARAVLPNATATAIVVTGNYRAWRHFIGMRATEAADVEIRTLAVALLVELQALAPNVFADFRVSALPDGSAVAASPLVGEG